MSAYTVNLFDRPGHWFQLQKYDDVFDACDCARRESDRQPAPVEVWRVGAGGASVLRRYVNGEEVSL